MSDVSLRPTPLVVANPPFFRADNGPGSPNPWKRAARTEVHGGLLSFIETAARTVRPCKGRICFVLPADRLQDAIQGAEANGLHLWRIVFVVKKRVLLVWGTEVRSATKDIILETDSRVDQWYALACVPAGT